MAKNTKSDLILQDPNKEQAKPNMIRLDWMKLEEGRD